VSNYYRVIPRDLFNEANLLKCYGQIYLNLERLNLPGVELVHDDEAFDIEQSCDDGSTFIVNVALMVRGFHAPLFRPLNSRDAWPLYMATDEDDIAVFNDDGAFSEEMLRFLNGQ
jgi:hypothetical protein